MVRATNAVASHRRKKKMTRRAKGFWGDRKNHMGLTKEAVIRALSENYRHRKLRKREFRRLWIARLSVAAKMNGISYSSLIDGLSQAKTPLNRKILSEIAIQDPKGFTAIVEHIKGSL
jgi:large subunit ribosomal protein L20